MLLDKDDILKTPGPTKYQPKDISIRSPSWKISELKRDFGHKESKNPPLGVYGYKSFIGETPKYTFRGKFNMDGTLDGKRHANEKKKPENFPSPGPGEYDVKDNYSSPKYTIGLKRDKKILSRHPEIKPDVGKYDLRRDKDLDVPCNKFSMSSRDNLEVNKHNLNYPEPGKYTINMDILGTTSPKWSFGMSSLDRFGRLLNKKKDKSAEHSSSLSSATNINTAPGPGSYEYRKYMGVEGKKYTFGKSKFNHAEDSDEYLKTKTQNFPNPWTYNKDIKYKADSPQYSISKLSRKEISRNRKDVNPDRPELEPNYLATSKFERGPKWAFSKTNKDDDAPVDGSRKKKFFTPDPTKYYPQNNLIPQGPAFTMRFKPIKKEQKDEVGPGKYSPTTINHGNEPKYSFEKGQRSDPTKEAKKNNYPSPGSYNIKDPMLTREITFPKHGSVPANRRVRNELLILREKMGPGSYRIPTSFDYINNMARDGAAFDPTYKFV